MPKPVNCCVPGCLNNFRKGSGLQSYRIPKDMHLRKQYGHLIRNKTLKLESENTRICSQHFEGGQKLHPQHLLSIFPWTKSKEKRRELKRLEVPRARECSKSKVPSVSSVIEPAMTATIAEENRIKEESVVARSAEIAMHQLSFTF